MHLEIITPSGAVFNQEVTSVSAPGIMGQFQVLTGHANLLSGLQIGILKVEYENLVEYYTCNGGVLEVIDNNINILTEAAEYSKDIDPDRAHKAKERAQDRLKNRNNSIDIDRAEIALQRSLNRLKILQLK